MEYQISLQNFIFAGVLGQSLRLWLIIILGLVPVAILVSEIYSRTRIKKIKLTVDFLTVASRTTPLLFQFYFFYFLLMSGSLSFMISLSLVIVEILNEESKSLKKKQDGALVRIIPSISDQLSVLIYGAALISIAESSKSLKDARVCIIGDFDASGFVIIGCLYLVLALLFVALNLVMKKLIMRKLK